MMNTTAESIKARKVCVFQHFSFYEQFKLHAQLELIMNKVLYPRGQHEQNSKEDQRTDYVDSNKHKYIEKSHVSWDNQTRLVYMLGNLHAFLSSANFSRKNIFFLKPNTIRVLNSLDPDQSYCWACSGSKRFAQVINSRQKLQLIYNIGL